MRDLAQVAAALGGSVRVDESGGGLAVDAGDLERAARGLKGLGGYMLFDLSAVDRIERLEVFYRFFELDLGIGSTEVDSAPLMLKTSVPSGDPTLPSLRELWKSADVMEREAWDLLGLRFTGRAELPRILNREDFVGHPLRKDFAMPRMDRFPAAGEGGRE